MDNYLSEEKLSVLMRRYSLPCIISLLFGALYNIVDQIFIANAAYLGSYGNAANTVVFPLTVIALAVAVMIGDGCCAYVSISLGKGNRDHAASSIGSAVILTVISSLVIMAVYLVFSDAIITAFGGRVNQQTYSFSKEYFFWISVGIPFYVFGQSMNPIIRSDGSPRLAMIATVSGGVLNMILDPIFIFCFKWGMTGAAAATVAGQVVTAAISIVYLTRMKTVRLSRQCFKVNAPLAKVYIPLGMCSFFSQISLVASMAAVNNMTRKYGALDPVFGQVQYAQIPMAVLGIVMKFFQIVISIVVGMAAGCIPIAGFNMGAGRKDRAKQLFTRLLACEAVVGLAALLVAQLFPGQLIGLFGAGNESIYYSQFAVKAFRIYLSMMVLAAINKASFIYLQALGKAWLSTGLSMFKEVFLGVLLPVLLPVWFGLDGVLYSLPLSDIIAFIISVIAIIFTYRELS